MDAWLELDQRQHKVKWSMHQAKTWIVDGR